MSEHPPPQAGAEVVEEFSTPLCHLVFGVLCLARAKTFEGISDQDEFS